MHDTSNVDTSDIPIIVLSFDRPEYLGEVLRSLRNQNGIDWSKRRIALFQDNAVNAYSRRKHAAQEDIDASIAVFHAIFPEGEVRLAEANLGVCENYLRAEAWAFEELKAEFAYFFEDDMILSPSYILMMNQLAQMVAAEERIGYFSAHGKHDLPMKDQIAWQRKLSRLGQHWGFGLRRSHWLQLQTWLKPYYDLVVGRDYRERPTEDILEYFWSIGAPVSASSQDDIKKTGTYVLGSCSINTIAVFGQYIGEIGLGMNANKFKKIGYAKTAMFKGVISKLDPLASKQVDNFIHAELTARWERVKRTRLAAALKPPATSMIPLTALARALPSATANAGPTDLGPAETTAPCLPAGVMGLRPLIEAANGRLKLGARQRGFAVMSAHDFMMGGHHLFEFSPISELFVQYQLSTLPDDRAIALLRQAYLAAGDDTRITLHEFDEAEATEPQKKLNEQGAFHARSIDALTEFLSSAGFTDITAHRSRLASGEVRETFTPDITALVDPKMRGAVTGVLVSAFKRRGMAPDFFNHTYTIRTRQCVDENFEKIPWLTYPAIEYLKQLDLSEKRIFEYGCGNSTVFWSQRCKEVVSVDHNAQWFDVVRSWQLPGSTLLHEEAKKLYARSIQDHGKFDLIVIDGVFRELCAEIAPASLADGGMIIFDNSERFPETMLELRNLGFIQVDFVGYVPLNRTLSVTSFFLKRDFAYKPLKDHAPKYRWGLHDAPERRGLESN